MTTELALPEKRNRVEETGGGNDGVVDAAADGKAVGETNALTENGFSVAAAPATASNIIIQLVSETGETLGKYCWCRLFEQKARERARERESSISARCASCSTSQPRQQLKKKKSGPQLDVPSTVTQQQLAALVNDLKGTPAGTADALPYAFFVDGELQLLPSLTLSPSAKDADADVTLPVAAKKNKKAKPQLAPAQLDSLGALLSAANRSVEGVVSIQYRPQASFRARAVCRCSASLAGHADAVLSVSFSPDGRRLASGSGDTTVRLWSLDRQGSPEATLQGAHAGWVLAVSWSPDGKLLATAGMDSVVGIWEMAKLVEGSTASTKEGKASKASASSPAAAAAAAASAAPNASSPSSSPSSSCLLGVCKGHTRWVTSLAWEPAHLLSPPPKSGARDPPSSRLATGSKDGTVRVWDARKGRRCLATMPGHRLAVTSVVWGGGAENGGGEGEGGGGGRIFSASRDGTIRVWCPENYTLVTELKGHGHWVNALALSTGYALRTGAFDHEGRGGGGGGDGDEKDGESSRDKALARYRAARGGSPASSSSSSSSSALRPEVLASASDDFTVILWHPHSSSKPFARLTGHSAPVTAVSFSPDGRKLATASFDKSVRLWCGLTGRYLATLRGHVGAVYALAWAPDSRLLLSGSKDSTLKVWDAGAATADGRCRIAVDLPGHADEVFAVDWAPAGGGAASGSKDKLVRLWRH